MSFDKYCSAILLAPGRHGKCAKAMVEVIYGNANPGGRLTNTLYNDTEEHFERLRKYKDAKRNIVGTYYGYRHYVSSGYDIKYPFGFGLSYTKFKYSKLRINQTSVEFTVKNTGKREGTEVVQVYVGTQKSSVFRPKKELKAFFKVQLRSGEKKVISFPISDLDLNIYDANGKKYVREITTYDVYIGSSATDDKLKGTFLRGV
jgi:beta-glucosidase